MESRTGNISRVLLYRYQAAARHIDPHLEHLKIATYFVVTVAWEKEAHGPVLVHCRKSTRGPMDMILGNRCAS